MWPVDPPGTAAFLTALASTHTRTTIATSYLGGVPLGDVTLESGIVRVTGSSQVRRRASLVVPESSWTDAPSPYGVELRVWSVISQGATAFPRVPIFTGRVESRTRDRRSGKISLECWDRFAAINDDAFEAPRPAPAGQRISDTIGTLIQETFTDVAVSNTATSGAVVPAGLTWGDGDGSRGLAIDKMALSIGAEVLALADGTFLIRDYPTMFGPVAWTVGIGSAGVIVSDRLQQARSGVANRWVITGNQTAAAASVRSVVTITSGPLAYGGPYGRVVRTYTDPMITTVDQATVAGNAILARVQGMGRQRDLGTIVNPALEAGDLIQVSTEDGLGLHIADSFSVPFGVDTVTMPVTSRSTDL